MLLMAKKKPGRKAGPPTTQTGLRLNTALMEALEELCARTRRTKTAEIEIALEAHLREVGLWPQPQPLPPKAR